MPGVVRRCGARSRLRRRVQGLPASKGTRAGGRRVSIFGNLSDLAHEIRSGVGTVLTILGSKLEADARARVECGPQWLTEFEEQRDSLEPDGQLFECSAPTCGCHDDPRYQAFPAPEDSAVAAADPCSCGAGYTSAAECPWCREVGDCICWVGHGDCGGCSGVLGISHEPACGWQWDPSCPQYGDGLKASAASALAADPSSARPSPSPASAGVEGPGGASDIPQSAPPGQPTSGRNDIAKCRFCPINDGITCYLGCDEGRRIHEQKRGPVPVVVAGESPREEDEQPSLGAAVTHEDLAAHLIGAAIRANTGHVDVLVEAFASSLLADFNITVREAAGK